MTTTPNEPLADPDVVPSGDPKPGADPDLPPPTQPEVTSTSGQITASQTP